jgi:hypothetical protein
MEANPAHARVRKSLSVNGILLMTISARVSESGWDVSVETSEVAGGFASTIHVAHRTPEETFEHQFIHGEVFPTEREAVLSGLREGMLWLELKIAKTIRL